MTTATEDEVRVTVQVGDGPKVPLEDVQRALEQPLPRTREVTRICEEIARKVEEDRDFAEPLTTWPNDEQGKREAYTEARQPRAIARELVRCLREFEHLHRRPLLYLYSQDAFTVHGAPALGKCQKPGGLLKHLSEADFILVFAHLPWMKLTAWQKVALVYHELRHAAVNEESGKPEIYPHQFEGFLDELEVFGVETFRHWAQFRIAAVRGTDVKPKMLQGDIFDADEEAEAAD